MVKTKYQKRFVVTLDPELKQKIKLASLRVGLTMSAFVRTLAVKESNKILEESA